MRLRRQSSTNSNAAPAGMLVREGQPFRTDGSDALRLDERSLSSEGQHAVPKEWYSYSERTHARSRR